MDHTDGGDGEEDMSIDEDTLEEDKNFIDDEEEEEEEIRPQIKSKKKAVKK